MKLLKNIKGMLPRATRKSAAVILTVCLLLTAVSANFSGLFVSAAEPAVLTPTEFTFEYADAAANIAASSFSVAADPTNASNKVLQLNGTGDNAAAAGKINAVFLSADGNTYYTLKNSTYYAFSMDVYVPTDSDKTKFSMALQGLDSSNTALSYNSQGFNDIKNTFFQLSYNSTSVITQQKITQWSARTEIDGIKKGSWITLSGYFNTPGNLNSNTALALNINCDGFTDFKPCFDNIEIYELDKTKSNILLDTHNKSRDIVVLQGEEGQAVDPTDYMTNNGYRLLGCYNYEKPYVSGEWVACAALDTADSNRFNNTFPAAGIYMVCADWEKVVLEPDADFGFDYASAEANIAESSFSVVDDPTDSENLVLQLNGTDDYAPVSGKTNAVYLTSDGTVDGIYQLTPGNKYYAFSMDVYLPENSADDFSMQFGALNSANTALSYNQSNFGFYGTADYQLIYNSAENIQQQKIIKWGNRVEFSDFKTGKWVTVAGYFKTTNSFAEGSSIALSVDCANISDFKPCFDNIKIYALDTAKSNLILNTCNADREIVVLQGAEGQAVDPTDYMTNIGYNLLGCYNYAVTKLPNGEFGLCATLDTTDSNRFNNTFPAAGINMVCGDWLSDLKAKTTTFDFENYPDKTDSETSALFKEAKAEKTFEQSHTGDASLGFNISSPAKAYVNNIAYLNDGKSDYIVKAGVSYAFDFYWYEPTSNKSERIYIKFIGLDGATSPDNITVSNLFTVRPALYDISDDSRADYGVNGSSNQINIIFPRLTYETARGQWNRCTGYFTVPAGNTDNHLGISVSLDNTDNGIIFIDDFSVTELDPTESTVIFAAQNADRDVYLMNGKPGDALDFPSISALDSSEAALKYYTFAEAGSVNSNSDKTAFATDKFPSAAGARVVISAKSNIQYDANGDWAVDIIDLIRVKKYAAGVKNTNVIFNNANVSAKSDGIDPYNITAYDVAAMRKHLLGIAE